MALCQATRPADNRRLFWSTQPNCNTTIDDCGDECGMPGLALVDPCDTGCPPTNCPNTPKTISTEHYLRGIAYNILLTDAAPEINAKCGFRPGHRGGHWSQSYAPAGYYIGSRFRKMSTTGTIDEQVGRAKALANADLQKMVKLGLATKITVDAKYAGSGRIALSAKLYGEGDDPAILGLSGTRSKSAWIWATQGI